MAGKRMQFSDSRELCLRQRCFKPLLVLVLSALPLGNASAQTPETFVPTGNMTTARVYHTATLLKDGRVLIAGGSYAPYPSPNPSGLPIDLASAEIYDPSTGTFSSTGSMSTARERHTATLLPDGRVLIAGGLRYGITSSRDTTMLASAELYDPISGTFSPTGDMTGALMLPVATLLNNGKVLISGGYFSQANRAELYDPALGTFSRMDMANVTGSKAEPLFDGRILIAGGFYSPTGALYDPTTNTVTPAGYLARPYPVVEHTTTLLPTGKVLIAGGGTQESYGDDVLAHAELYDPSRETFETTDSLRAARAGHTAKMLPGGLVLIAGGYGNQNGNIAELFDPSPTAELFDPFTETFRFTGAMTAGRTYATATLLRNGTVLITGGYNMYSAEIYLPPPPPFLAFERTRLRAGESFTATFSETHVSDDTYCDLRFRAPGDTAEYLALNWQRGRSATHNVATGMAAGAWTVTGVRPHQDIDDHNGDFASVSVELQVIR
jgi:galactose oxidase-like protein